MELKASTDDDSSVELTPSGIAVNLVKSFTLDSSGEPQSLEEDDADDGKPQAGPSFDLSLLFFLAVPLCCDKSMLTSYIFFMVKNISRTLEPHPATHSTISQEDAAE